jgi:hypothetical protein
VFSRWIQIKHIGEAAKDDITAAACKPLTIQRLKAAPVAAAEGCGSAAATSTGTGTGDRSQFPADEKKPAEAGFPKTISTPCRQQSLLMVDHP